MAVILVRVATIGGHYDAEGNKVGAANIRARYETLTEARAQVDHEGEGNFLRIEDEETGEVLWQPEG